MTDANTGAVVHGASDSPWSVEGPRAQGSVVRDSGLESGHASAPPATSHHVRGDVMAPPPASHHVMGDGSVSGSVMAHRREQCDETSPGGTRPRAMLDESRSAALRSWTIATSRIGGSPVPGTQFSRVSWLWKKRETTAMAARRRLPLRKVQQAISVMQSALQDVEQKVVDLACRSAEGMESTRRASEEALASVKSVHQESQQRQEDLATRIGTLHGQQQQQAGVVSTLQSAVQQVRQDATQMAVSTDLTARTSQAAKTAELQKQQNYLQDVVQQLQAELGQRSVADQEKEAQLAQLQAEIEHEKQARESLQQYVDDLEYNLQPVDLGGMAVDDQADQHVRVSNIAGLNIPTNLHVDLAQQATPPHVQFSLPVAPVVKEKPKFMPPFVGFERPLVSAPSMHVL